MMTYGSLGLINNINNGEFMIEYLRTLIYNVSETLQEFYNKREIKLK